MNKIIKFLLGFFLIIYTSSLIAQPLRTVTYETKLLVADEAAEDNNWYEAIEYYTKAYEESKDLNLQLAIADLYVVARDFNKGERIYERLLKRDKTREYEDIRVDYARVLKSQGKYKEAVNQFNIVIADAEIDDSLKMVAKKELAGIEMIETLAPNLEAIVNPIEGKVNSASAESSPIQGPDGSLYFSSFNRKKEILLDGKETDFHAKLFVADKNDKGGYDKVTEMPESINRPGFNSGGVAFSRDGKRMYFTRAVLKNNLIDKSTIFVSTNGADGWGVPIEIEELKGDYILKHPVVGELFGNEVLFFSSDMDGGAGKFDIYYSTIKGDTYGLPTNLGTTINTAADEISPFYNNGTLYFSSNGHPSMGGFDIYYATWNGSNWEKLTNIGFNYNSAYDDTFLRFNETGSNGFLVSNRPHKDKTKMKGTDGCCDDIYGVYIRDLVIDLLVNVEDETGPLNGAGTDLYDLSLGGYPETKSNINTNVFNFPLQADRNYKTIFKKEGYFSDSITFNTNGILDDYTVKKTIKLKKDPNYDPNKGKGKDGGGETVTVTANEPIRLNNIYYDYDKSNILLDAEDDLYTLLGLLEDYSDMVIELSSHTDARGDDKYNQKLSQRRAESAKKWLTDKGISSDRIKPVGYGEKQILNNCKNGVKCTDDEHRQNRRTEFKIIAGPQTIEIKKAVFDSKGGDRSGEDKKSTKGGSQSFSDKKISLQKTFPAITFDAPLIDLGKVKKGEQREVVFNFTNTGNADLIIEVATTCKCTDLTFPKEVIKPGGKGTLKGIYHTDNENLGEIQKIIDIIANTDPIVVEAKFKAEIVAK
jgi:peptidoglycan-associated lipoprotein